MMEEKFFLYSAGDQVIKITFLDSISVLLDMLIYQCSCTCGKIAMLIVVIKLSKYEIAM